MSAIVPENKKEYLKISKAYGGTDTKDFKGSVIVGIPQYIASQKNIVYDNLKYLVLDEADKLITDVDMNAQVRDVMMEFLIESKGDHKKKILLFSATYANNFKWLVWDFVKEKIKKDDIYESLNYNII